MRIMSAEQSWRGNDSLALAVLVAVELAGAYITQRAYVNELARCERELSPSRIEYTLKPCDVDGLVYGLD